MYYRLLPQLQPIEPEDIDLSVLTAGYIDCDGLEAAIDRFGFTDISPEACLADRDNYRNLVDV